VIRSLDPVEGLKSMSDLGVTGKNLQILKSSIRRPTGMTLVTGPTGSGKTTTLYSALHTLNNESVNIVTLEDPVEYFIDGVSQSQVNSDIGYVFANGLRQILRQDPDIIMVGEIRDEETADLAVHASLTGHMVLSTLHTNNALGVIPRLIDMGIKPYLIPPALNTAMAQRLVRRICDKCKEPVVPTEEMRILITEELRSVSTETLKDYGVSSLSNIKLYKPKGCRYCSEEGFVGRIGVYEALRMTPDLGEIIMESPTEKELTAEAKRQRMVSLRQDGIIKAITGYTTIEEVLRVTGDGA
jgi:type IV pilus assembly protein PilB